jgi:hypothetical protein
LTVSAHPVEAECAPTLAELHPFHNPQARELAALWLYLRFARAV